MKAKVMMGVLGCLAVLLAVGAIRHPSGEESKPEHVARQTERSPFPVKRQTADAPIEAPSKPRERAKPEHVNLTQRQEAIISLQVGLLDKMEERALKSKNERLFAIVQAEKAKVIGTARLLGE